MNKYSILAGTVVFVGLAGLAVYMNAGVGSTSAKDGTFSIPEEFDLAEGMSIYGEYCAACHGANLEGQENWRTPGEDGILPAPPHDATGHTWHHDDVVLFNYTKLGGQGIMAARGIEIESGMPAFGEQLSDQQIWDVLEYIKSTWPEDIQEVQKQRTKAALGL